MTSSNTQPQPPGRYDSLDLWRGVACLLVVVLHAGEYAADHAGRDGAVADPVGSRLLSAVGRGGVGVQLFFVISGYCIAATVVAARRTGSPAARFFVRRFRRIFPPYWAALGLMIGLAALAPTTEIARRLTAVPDRGYPLVPDPSTLSAAQWLGNLTLTEHWRWHLIGDTESKLHGPAWTLCYEEQFYAVCGVLLLTVRRRFFAGVAAVTLGTLATVFGCRAAGGHVPGGFFFDGRWLLFAAGVAVYWHVAAARGRARRVVPGLLAAGLVGSAWFRYVYLRGADDAAMRQMAFEWALGGAFALLLLALYGCDRKLARAAALRPLFGCGRMCYSLYLVHWPVTLVVGIWLYGLGVRDPWPTLLITLPVGTAASLLAAWLFFRLVERRFWNGPHAAGDRVAAPGRPAAANLRGTCASADADPTRLAPQAA